MASSVARPLKVAGSSTPAKGVNANALLSGSATPQSKSITPTSSSTTNVTDISSPHELTAFVENLLEQLDAKFEDMSTQMLDRMNQMSARVDALEASIQDIINGDVSSGPSAPQSPAPGTPGILRPPSF